MWLLIARRKTLKTFVPITSKNSASGCSSQVRDPDFFYIPDLGSAIHQKQKRVEIKICCLPFFWSYNSQNCNDFVLTFEQVQIKCVTNWQGILVFLTPKIVTKLSEIWVWIWESRNGIQKNLSRIRIQGSKSTVSRIRIRSNACSLDPLFINFYNKKNIVETGLRDLRVTIIYSVL